MKTLLLSALICISLNGFGQTKKDYTEKELLTNKRIIEFSESMETTPLKTINFLKCIKTESKIKNFKNLPFFSGKFPLIVNEKMKHHNTEMWEIIHQECKEKTIFNN